MSASSSAGNMDYDLLYNPENVKSDPIDLNEAKQHEREAASSPIRYDYTAAHHSAHNSANYDAPTYEEEAPPPPMHENPKIERLLREYELVPPPQKKGMKMKVLVALKRYETLGFPLSQQYTIDSDYYEMLCERESIIHMKNRDNSIKISQQFLLTFVQTLEWSNEKFNPFNLRLKGLYDTTYAHIDDYHEILGELIDKYQTADSKMEPEMKLALTLLGGVLSNHIVQSNVEETLMDGSNIANKGKKQVFRQFQNMTGLKNNNANANNNNNAASGVAPVPIGGYAPQPMYNAADVKEYKNETDEAIQQQLKEELNSLHSASLDTQGKPRKRKSAKPLKL